VARLTIEQWADVRAEREASGRSFRDLAAKHGVSDVAIVKRAQKEGWGDGSDVGRAIRRKVSEKLAGISTADPKKKEAALDGEAEKGAAVIIAHREDWDEHRRLYPIAAIKEDFEMGKKAKISAEVIMLRQKGERQAHNLDETSTGDRLEDLLEKLGE